MPEDDDLVHVVRPAGADQPQVSRATSVCEQDHFRNFLCATVRYEEPPESSKSKQTNDELNLIQL